MACLAASYQLFVLEDKAKEVVFYLLLEISAYLICLIVQCI